jgi:hypothetical protein
MSCALTQDLLFDCRDSMGGLLEMYAMPLADANAITVTAGVVTGITKATGKKFWKWQLPRETGEMKSTIQGNEQNGSLFFQHEAKIAINKLSSQMRNEVLLIAKNRLLLVGKDQNGVFWMVGRERGMLVKGGSFGTGVQSGDRSGIELEFESAEREPMIEVDATTAAALQTAGS